MWLKIEAVAVIINIIIGFNWHLLTCRLNQWSTQDFFGWGFIPGIFSEGGSLSSGEARGLRERGCGGRSPPSQGFP
jgi:hypothetical protein